MGDSHDSIFAEPPDTASAVTQVLQTPELLERIIGCSALSNKDLVSCAIVCRLWNDPSLNKLWSYTGLSDLLLVLPCVERDGSSVLRVKGNISIAQWDRLLYYSRRIRELNALYYDDGLSLSDELLSEIAFSRPGLQLFPRLKKLWWGGNTSEFRKSWIRFSRILLDDTLLELVIDIPEDRDVADIMTFVSELPSRSPNLSRLSFYSSEHGLPLGLRDTLTSLRELVEIKLPSRWSEPDVIGAIAGLPKLTTLTGGLDPVQKANFTKTLDPNSSFPSLTSVDISSGSSRIVKQLLDSVSNRENLSTLTVGLTESTEYALESFTRDALYVCPDLKTLTIHHTRLENDSSSFDFSEENIEELPFLSRSTLSHLRGFRHLELLSITYHKPSEMTDNDLMDLVEALPNLVQLQFRCLPFTTEHPCLTLGILHRLSTFFRHRPEFRGLSKLELQVNALQWPDHSVDELLSSADTLVMGQLKSLCLDGSPISSVVDVALYLSQLIPPEAKVLVGATCYVLPLRSTPGNNPNHKRDLEEMRTRKKYWSEVSTQVKSFHRLQSILSKRISEQGKTTLPN